MSKVGSLTAFAAEAAIWLAGAAIVAGAAGAHWDTPSVDLNALWPAASPSLVKNFTTTISADDFQASGSAIGTVSVTINGQKIDGTYSGTFKFKGNDSSSTMTMTMAGTKTTNDSVSVGDSDYSRTNGGAWTKTARSATNMSFRVLTAGGVTDKGVELHDGQKLHHLDLVKTPDPKSLFNDSDHGQRAVHRGHVGEGRRHTGRHDDRRNLLPGRERQSRSGHDLARLQLRVPLGRDHRGATHLGSCRGRGYGYNLTRR